MKLPKLGVNMFLDQAGLECDVYCYSITFQMYVE